MTTRALKRDLAALEKDMSPVTLASEARGAAGRSRRGVLQGRSDDLAALEKDMSPVTLASEARGAAGALRRDLAALEKDMSPVTLASEARVLQGRSDAIWRPWRRT